MITDNKIHSLECKCFTWKPIFAGALAAIGFSFLLYLFSVAIGLTAYSTSSQGIENLALGGLIATCLGVIVSMFAAGWIAGYLGNRHCTKRHLGALYGFLTWCLAIIIMSLITRPMLHYVAFYSHFISGSTFHPIAKAAAQLANAAAAPQTKVVISTYIIFCIFFLSAFACSLGGHCGMRHISKDRFS